MFMYSPIAPALSLSPLFATTFFLLCNNVWLRRGVAKQWDAPPLSHKCVSRMLSRPKFSLEGFKAMYEEKLLLKQYPGARRLFFCESERKMSYWNGTWHCPRRVFFVPAAFFTPPPFSTGEKQCVQNDTKWKRPNWNLRNTFYYYLHLALKNYAAHSTIFYQPFRSKGQKQQRETTRAYYTCTHIRKEGGGDLPWKVLCPLEWHYRTWQIIWHSDLINIGFLWWFRAFIKLNYRSGRALSLSLFFFSWTLSTLIA